MKQKDIILIVVIALVSGVVSFFLSTKIFVTPDNRQQKVEVVDVISPTFQTPDSRYFNSNSIDPAQLVEIGSNNNQNPFSSANQ